MPHRFRDSLFSADVALALLRRSREDLECSAAALRALAADVHWESDAVRYVYERADAIQRRLSGLVDASDTAIAEVLDARRRVVRGIELLGG